LPYEDENGCNNRVEAAAKVCHSMLFAPGKRSGKVAPKCFLLPSHVDYGKHFLF
jgi:hypothetical protein